MSNDLRPVADVSSLAAEMGRAFPNSSHLVADVIADVDENGGFLEYGLITDAFRWGILEDAIRSRDDSQIGACFNFIERLVASPDDRIVDAVVIRVIPYLLHNTCWKNLTVQYAGIQTSFALDRYMDGGDWQRD